MINGSIYIIKNKCNKKVYIGQTIQEVEVRFKQHLKLLKSNSKQIIYQAIREIGGENFYVETLESNIQSQKELDYLEEKYIKEYNSIFPNGYNKCLNRLSSKNFITFSNEEIKDITEKYNNGNSTRCIALEYNVSYKTILNVLKASGCKIRSKTCNLPDRSSKITKEILIELFVTQKKSTTEIAQILNVSERTIRRRISIFNLREYNAESF